MCHLELRVRGRQISLSLKSECLALIPLKKIIYSKIYFPPVFYKIQDRVVTTIANRT